MSQKFRLFAYFSLVYFFICSLSPLDASSKVKKDDNNVEIKVRKKKITRLFQSERKKHLENKYKSNAPQEPNALQEETKKLFFLETRKEHLDLLKDTLKMAKYRVIISSPLVSSEFIDNYFIDWVKENKNGVRITIYTNMEGYDACLKLRDMPKKTINPEEIEVKTLNNCYIYALIMDNNLLANGAFNWLYNPNEEGAHLTTVTQGEEAKNLEEAVYITTVIQGEEVKNLITASLKSLKEALQTEKHLSLRNAEAITLQELQEDIIPREIPKQNYMDKDVPFLENEENKNGAQTYEP